LVEDEPLGFDERLEGISRVIILRSRLQTFVLRRCRWRFRLTVLTLSLEADAGQDMPSAEDRVPRGKNENCSQGLPLEQRLKVCEYPRGSPRLQDLPREPWMADRESEGAAKRQIVGGLAEFSPECSEPSHRAVNAAQSARDSNHALRWPRCGDRDASVEQTPAQSGQVKVADDLSRQDVLHSD